MLGKPYLSPAHRLDQRVADIFAQKLIAHLATAIAPQCHLALWKKALDIAAKQQQAGVCGNVAGGWGLGVGGWDYVTNPCVARQAAAPEQERQRVACGGRAAALDIRR